MKTLYISAFERKRNDLIQNIRIRKAEQLLLKNDSMIFEVAYKVGIGDPKYFSRCFKLKYGLDPSMFQKSHRYSKCKIV
nr:helix-turn-helix domain-containing protein [uncultured Bacteroides sp.]